MIDLHVHLLPGIDDGPSTLERALSMCRQAGEDGCTDLVATPHQRHEFWWNGEDEPLRTLRDELEEGLRERMDDPPRLHLGAEVRVGEGLLEALDLRAEGRADSGVLPLAGSRYLLLELSRYVPEPDPAGLIHEVVVAGWRPILAHPEQIHWLVDDLPLVERLVGLGAMLQVTGASVLGRYGRATRDRARNLLDAELAHFLASDGHDLDARPPGLSAGRAAVAHRWGEEVAERLTETNPRAVLDDRPLTEPGRAAAPRAVPVEDAD